MNSKKYTELTGITISEADKTLFEAQVRRTRIALETMLGFTLSRDKINTNIYNELGKTNKDCFCLSVNTSTEVLQDPDEVENAYRLFRFNKKDRYFEVDPFTAVHSVKLVKIQQGQENGEGITIKTFDKDKIRLQLGRDGIGKYIERCRECMCDCNCNGDCVQLAVDADWLFDDCLPIDLLDVWADMVQYQMDCKKDIRSESMIGYSYTKFDRVDPETTPKNIAILQRYAGPYGSVSVMPI